LSKACVVDDVMHGYESSESSVDVDDNYETKCSILSSLSIGSV
jgi:hypothetical protein